VGVAHCWNKLAPRKKLRNLHAKSEQPSSYSFRDLSVHPDRQTDMARSTWLVILIKNIYTLWGRKRFLLPVTYFSTSQGYPFTLQVTGITSNYWCLSLNECWLYMLPTADGTILSESYVGRWTARCRSSFRCCVARRGVGGDTDTVTPRHPCSLTLSL